MSTSSMVLKEVWRHKSIWNYDNDSILFVFLNIHCSFVSVVPQMLGKNNSLDDTERHTKICKHRRHIISIPLKKMFIEYKRSYGSKTIAHVHYNYYNINKHWPQQLQRTVGRNHSFIDDRIRMNYKFGVMIIKFKWV